MKIKNVKVADFEINEKNFDCVELINLAFSADIDGVPYSIELGDDDWFSIGYDYDEYDNTFTDEGVECSDEFTLKIISIKTDKEIDYDSISDEDWDKFYPILRDAGIEYFSEHSADLIRQALDIKYRDDGPDYDGYCDRAEARLMDYYDRKY